MNHRHTQLYIYYVMMSYVCVHLSVLTHHHQVV